MDGHGPAIDPWGIQDAFTDAMGSVQVTHPEVREALRRAMGSPEPDPGSPASPVARIDPGACPPPPSRRAWGFALQLYSLRSSESWGIGDLADLRRFGAWASNQGARFLQVNPLMTAQPVPPLQPSPYYPCSRRFPNPLYLRIEEVPGFSEAAAELDGLVAEARALNSRPLIERDAIFGLKSAALEILWARSGESGGRELDRFVAEGGGDLAQYATYCVLAETHGSDWRRWPPEHRHPAASEVAAFGGARRPRVAFHQWVQWLLDQQLRKAAEAIPLLHDLPIGFDPGGLDAWAWQDLLALEAKIGAPPDEFNRQGQDWGLPPFIPHRLRAAGYAPLRQTLRAVLRHAGGLRVDHVMGLFRLYWIPPGGTAANGAFVRYRHEEMLSVVTEECRRARAFAVGEDLGTVEPGIRETLARCGILGSKVFWFDKDQPSQWPPGTFASLTTHDLPTVAGLWTGADAAEQASLGLLRNAEAMRPMVDKLKALAGIGRGADRREVVRKVHRILSEAGSSLIAASLEDALGVERRPNLPGTVDERPNWRIPLPLSLEAIEKDPLVLEVAAAMDRRP